MLIKVNDSTVQKGRIELAHSKTETARQITFYSSTSSIWTHCGRCGLPEAWVALLYSPRDTEHVTGLRLFCLLSILAFVSVVCFWYPFFPRVSTVSLAVCRDSDMTAHFLWKLPRPPNLVVLMTANPHDLDSAMRFHLYLGFLK